MTGRGRSKKGRTFGGTKFDLGFLLWGQLCVMSENTGLIMHYLKMAGW